MAGTLSRAMIKFKNSVGFNVNRKALHSSTTMSSKDASSNTLKSEKISENLELIINKDKKLKQRGQPLVVIFSWMLAKKSHVMKYGEFYMKQGFDVLTVKITPMQLFWPTTGSQVIAESFLQFLTKRDEYQPIVIHAFSVGAYLFGEALVKMKTDQKYSAIINRIAGQVYDSAADHGDIEKGFPKALTSNILLQKVLENYIRFHTGAFYKWTTHHYIRSSDQFYETIVPAPSLFLYSKSDPVATPEGMERVIKAWKARGMKVYSRCWEKSPHVSHMYYHQEEYIQEMETFLESLGLKVDRTKQSNL